MYYAIGYSAAVKFSDNDINFVPFLVLMILACDKRGRIDLDLM